MEKYEDTYNSSSMITRGQYEILFSSFNYCNPDTNEEEAGKAIQWLNGARVWFGGQLKYSIDYGTNPDTFRCINFTMPADDDKLGDFTLGNTQENPHRRRCNHFGIEISPSQYHCCADKSIGFK